MFTLLWLLILFDFITTLNHHICNRNECNIECNEYGDCQNFVFDAYFSSEIKLECNGESSCEYITFNASDTSVVDSNVSIICNGKRSCLFSDFYFSPNAKSISIYCGKDETSCSNTQIYCEFCDNIAIHLLDSCISSYIEIRCFLLYNKCEIQCKNKRIDLYGFNSFILSTTAIICNDQYFSCFDPNTNANEYFIHNDLECNSLHDGYNDIKYRTIWNIHHKQNCTSFVKKYFVCNPEQYTLCSVDCNILQCVHVEIDAFNVPLFNLLCTNTYCDDLYLICSQQDCDILCHENATCSNIDIYVSDNASVYFECISSYCSNITIHATNAFSIHLNLLCYNKSCRNITIFGENVTDEIRFIAIGNYATSNVSIFANYTHHISIESEGLFAINDSHIYAQHALHVVNVSCYGLFAQHSCFGSHVFLSSAQNYINCEATGCSSINLYFEDDIDYNALHISINGCSVCHDAVECLLPLYLYCNHSYACLQNANLSLFHYSFMDDYFFCKRHLKQTIINDMLFLECNNDSCINTDIDASYLSSFTLKCDSLCFNINIHCPLNGTCDIYCLQSSICNYIMIYTEDNKSNLLLECLDSANCYNIIILSQQAKHVWIKCNNCNYHDLAIYASHTSLQLDCIFTSAVSSLSNAGCNNITIHASNVSYIDVECRNLSTVVPNESRYICQSIYIFGTFVEEQITFISYGERSSYNIIVSGNNVRNMTVVAERYLSFVNSTIVALDSHHLMLSCVGYGGYSCYKSSVYLSSNRNHILCEGNNCQTLQLYYMYKTLHLNYSYLNISVNGCNQCHSFEACTDKMSFHCDYTQHNVSQSNISCILPTMVEAHNPQLTNYINDVFACSPYYDAHFSNRTLIICAYILAIVVFIVIAVIVCAVIHECVTKIYQRIHYIYISNRPWNYIFIAVAVSEFVIFTGFIWWAIKLTLYYDSKLEYCSAKYPTITDWSYCVEDVFCDLWDFTESRLDDKSCLHSNDGTRCECRAAKSIYAPMVAYWVLFGIVIVLEIMKTICFCDFVSTFKSNSQRETGVAQCITSTSYLYCCYTCNCCSESQYIQEINQMLWDQRKLWINVNENQCEKWWLYGWDNTVKYMLCVSVAAEHILWFHDFDHTDYSILLVEFYPILILIALKTSLQIYYALGPEYNSKREIPEEIIHNLEDMVPMNVAYVIRSFLPIFYNPHKCVNELLIQRNVMILGTQNTDKYTLESTLSVSEPETWEMIPLKKSE